MNADMMLNDLLFAVLFLHIQLMPMYIPSKTVDSILNFLINLSEMCIVSQVIIWIKHTTKPD